MSVGRAAVLVGLAGALALAVAADSTPSGQAERSQPSFPARAEAITVDVVVLDRDGQPVGGLTKEDFVLLEGGRPQPIVAFETRQAPAAEAGPRAAGEAVIPQRVVSNVGARRARGRVLVLLIDDLGLTPTMAQLLGPALAGWIREK